MADKMLSLQELVHNERKSLAFTLAALMVTRRDIVLTRDNSDAGFAPYLVDALREVGINTEFNQRGIGGTLVCFTPMELKTAANDNGHNHHHVGENGEHIGEKRHGIDEDPSEHHPRIRDGQHTDPFDHDPKRSGGDDDGAMLSSSAVSTTTAGPDEAAKDASRETS